MRGGDEAEGKGEERGNDIYNYRSIKLGNKKREEGIKLGERRRERVFCPTWERDKEGYLFAISRYSD